MALAHIWRVLCRRHFVTVFKCRCSRSLYRFSVFFVGIAFNLQLAAFILNVNRQGPLSLIVGIAVARLARHLSNDKFKGSDFLKGNLSKACLGITDPFLISYRCLRRIWQGRSLLDRCSIRLEF